MVQESLEALGEAAYRCPDPVEDLWRDKRRQVREILAALLTDLEEWDRGFCDQCGGRWDDDPYHKAYCEPADRGVDEYDIIRDALLTGAVVAGAPAPGPRPEGD